MPAVITVTRASPEPLGVGVQRLVTKVVFAWTATALGAVDETTTEHFSGRTLRLVTIPGVPQPLNNYDVQILDDDGVDILDGAGADRSNVVAEQFCPIITLINPNVIANTQLRLVVATAGALAQGTVVVYIE